MTQIDRQTWEWERNTNPIYIIAISVDSIDARLLDCIIITLLRSDENILRATTFHLSSLQFSLFLSLPLWIVELLIAAGVCIHL